MSPFRILGVAVDADATQVKRAYARLLRTHRPDEDPAAFQRLHDAYQACLQEIQWRALEVEADDAPWDDTTAPVPPLHSADAAADSAIDNALPERDDDAFDPDALLDGLVAAASDPDVDMQAWLHAHPALYALDNKDAVAERLVWRLLEDPPHPHRLAPILAFFELDVVNARYQRLDEAIQQLRAASAVAHGEIDLSFMPELQPPARPVSDQRLWWFIGWLVVVVTINLARQVLGK